MTNSTPKPLRSDPRRQAIPTHRGYLYQEWRSVLAWLQLKQGEVLWLEGAEDFDVLSLASAEVVQVKATSRKVTLCSRDILTAISNFWIHRVNNPGHRILFRFLTTSERGRERSRLLGPGSGLDLWDRCRRRNADLRQLRDFLSSRKAFPGDLREFVLNSSDDEFREELIARIEWDTGREPLEEIEDLVNREVIEYGEPRALFPSESKNVVAHLLKHVRDVICKEETRRLDRTDFALLFESVTVEPQPKRERREREIEALAQRSIYRHLDYTSTSGDAGLKVVEIIQAQALLPSTQRLAQRKALVSDLRSRLNLSGLLVISGSIQMGKSTLASLIAADGPAVWRPIPMSGMSPTQIHELLIGAAIADGRNETGLDYIVDDLNFDGQVFEYEKALVIFLYAILKRGGQVIITTQGALPSRIALRLDLSANATVSVPPLNTDDIGELATNFGCPLRFLDSWTKIIETNTAGHPILVHARIKGLENANWPKPGIQDIVGSSDIDQVRQEIRQRLSDLLPSEQSRTLAYRLSIMFAYFKRVHALEMGHHRPALLNPGEAFDLLVGPWVDYLGKGYYRVSPLLKGTNMFGSQETKALHRSAATAFLAEHTVTPTELDGVLFHSLAGEDPLTLSIAAQLCLGIGKQDWPIVCHEIEWLTFMSLIPGERLFKPDGLLSMMVRLVQFRVALEVDSSVRAPHILECWGKEFDQLTESERSSEWFVASELSFCNQSLFCVRVPLTAQVMVTTIARAVALTRTVKQSLPDKPLLRKLLGESIEDLDKSEDFLWGAAIRHMGLDDVDEFFSALSNVDAGISREIWDQLKDNDYLAMVLLDSMWLKEEKAAEPRWQKCIEVAERVALLAEANESYSLLAVAYRIKGIILAEYLHEPDAAFEAIAEGQGKCRTEHRVLRDYNAKLLSLEKRPEEAIKIWEELFPELEHSKVPVRTFSYRDAYLAAAELGWWSRAVEFALRAEKAAEDSQFTQALILGFAASRAWALWMAKDYEASLVSFVDIVDRFPDLPEFEDDPGLVALYRKVCYAVYWLGEMASGQEEVVRPQPAWFTDESVPQGKDLKLINSHPYVWYCLARLEHRSDLGDTAFRRFEEVSRTAGLPLIQCSVEELRIKRSIRGLYLDSLMDEYAEFSRMIRTLAKTRGGTETTQNNSKSAIDLILVVLIRMLMSVEKRVIPCATWRISAERYGFLDEAVGALLDFVELSPNIDEGGIIRVLKNLNANWSARLAASALLSASELVDPEDRFLANAFLLQAANGFGPWKDEAEIGIERFVSLGWTIAVEQQTASLLSPRTNVEPILTACRDDSCRGLRKAARIIVAAKRSVSIHISDELMSQLREIST